MVDFAVPFFDDAVGSGYGVAYMEGICTLEEEGDNVVRLAVFGVCVCPDWQDSVDVSGRSAVVRCAVLCHAGKKEEVCFLDWCWLLGSDYEDVKSGIL